MGAISVRNVVGLIWAGFVGILAIRVINPIYDIMFGSLTWNNPILKFSLEIIFMIAVFGVGFFVPFKVFTEYCDERGWDID